MTQKSSASLPKNIFGIVGLWGEVEEHKAGYRAQYGYPVAIVDNDPEACERVSSLYGAKAHIVSKHHVDRMQELRTLLTKYRLKVAGHGEA